MEVAGPREGRDLGVAFQAPPRGSEAVGTGAGAPPLPKGMGPGEVWWAARLEAGDQMGAGTTAPTRG